MKVVYYRPLDGRPLIEDKKSIKAHYHDPVGRRLEGIAIKGVYLGSKEDVADLIAYLEIARLSFPEI